MATAAFDTLEDQLKLRLAGDRRGHILVRGTAKDRVGTGNELEFGFEIDQSYLPEIMKELEAIEKCFPSREFRPA